MPPPENSEFQSLSIDKQFAYTKPVLRHILLAEYLPVKKLHDAFMSGGHKRTNLAKGAAYSGELTNEETEQLAAHVRRWALREDALGARRSNGAKPPPPKTITDDEDNALDMSGSYDAVTGPDAAEREFISEPNRFADTASEEKTEVSSDFRCSIANLPTLYLCSEPLLLSWPLRRLSSRIRAM